MHFRTWFHSSTQLLTHYVSMCTCRTMQYVKMIVWAIGRRYATTSYTCICSVLPSILWGMSA